MKILIADDDKVLSQALSAILKEGGHSTVTAFDAMQAFMFAVKHLPDLVLLDINMPGGTGVDVLRRLKKSALTMNMPVIIITSSKEQKLPDEVKKLGAASFLAKPIAPQTLLDAVREASA